MNGIPKQFKILKKKKQLRNIKKLTVDYSNKKLFSYSTKQDKYTEHRHLWATHFYSLSI